MGEAPLLEVRKLKKHFPLRRGKWGHIEHVRALDGVSFSLARGETLAVVGESGSGKSTAGKVILRLLEPTDGEVFLDGQRIDSLALRDFKPVRKKVQVVFQDPLSSLSPRMRVQEILGEPLRNFNVARGREAVRARVVELLSEVKLPADSMQRYPHEFSGGQRQRIAIARALAPNPKLVVCDEAVSALDVSVKAQIVNLLVSLQTRFGLSLLFISHDLSIVEHIAHRVAVLYLGKIVEIASRRDLFTNPRHPYTRALLAAVPVPDPTMKREEVLLKGEIPSAVSPPAGCRFHTRCPLAFSRCKIEEPELREASDGHLSACHLDS